MEYLGEKITETEIFNMIDYFDEDKDGKLSMTEFRRLLLLSLNE
jgi:Ca2+-binding EF-hand superfamily protein